MENMKKLLVFIIGATMMFITTGCSGHNTIAGFDGKVSIDFTTEEIRNNKPSVEAEISSDNENGIMYENVILGDKFTGKLYYWLDDSSEKIETIHYLFDSTEYKKIDDELSKLEEIFGEPLHKENYNDETRDSSKYLYKDGNIDIILTIDNADDSLEDIVFEREIENADDHISDEKELKTKRKKDKKLQEAYNLMYKAAELDGKPITKAIEEFEVSYSGKTEYGDIQFSKELKIFDYPAKIVFGVEDPYGDTVLADYTGEIHQIFIKFDNVDDEKKVLKKISGTFGKITTEKNEYNKEYNFIANKPLNFDIGCNYDDSVITLYPKINDEYYRIDPSFMSEEKFESIAAYDDVDLSILHAEENDYIGKVDVSSRKGQKIEELTKNKVKDYLKHPSTASFGDMNISQYGETITVEGIVSAENGFGVSSEMSYTLYFVVKDSTYTFNFGEIDGNLI